MLYILHEIKKNIEEPNKEYKQMNPIVMKMNSITQMNNTTILKRLGIKN
jgi:hypothetical protein